VIRGEGNGKSASSVKRDIARTMPRRIRMGSAQRFAPLLPPADTLAQLKALLFVGFWLHGRALTDSLRPLLLPDSADRESAAAPHHDQQPHGHGAHHVHAISA
jgi:hypothetical protein